MEDQSVTSYVYPVFQIYQKENARFRIILIVSYPELFYNNEDIFYYLNLKK